ncbi:hypothetical protein GWL_01120 [Herbaspirillum sp. GW103]|nr:hypothetical protein GWL_01120 [Herbaspirillum sp. GW103]
MTVKSGAVAWSGRPQKNSLPDLVGRGSVGHFLWWRARLT